MGLHLLGGREPGARGRSDLADRIKDRVTVEEAARRYGYAPGRNGFLRCPFHQGDRTASLKIYPGQGGWHCFGCGRGGSVIDFVMELYGLTFSQACLRLNEDFGLGLTRQAPDRKAIQAARRRAREEEERKAREEAEELALLAEHRYWWEVQQVFAPGPEGYIHPLYEQAVKTLPHLAWLLDCCADRRWNESAKRSQTEDGLTQKRIS